jgi:hypothetical protein
MACVLHVNHSQILCLIKRKKYFNKYNDPARKSYTRMVFRRHIIYFYGPMDVCVEVDLLITESMSRCDHPNINRCQTGYIINILLNKSSVKDKVPEILRSYFYEE